MKAYVIKTEYEWKNKAGKMVTSYAYYQKHSGFPIPLNHMVGNANEAKKFGSIKDARNAIIEFFGNSKKSRYTIESINYTLQP